MQWSAFSVPSTNSMHVAMQETSVQCSWKQKLQHSNTDSAIENKHKSARQGKAELDGLCST